VPPLQGRRSTLRHPHGCTGVDAGAAVLLQRVQRRRGRASAAWRDATCGFRCDAGDIAGRARHASAWIRHPCAADLLGRLAVPAGGACPEVATDASLRRHLARGQRLRVSRAEPDRADRAFVQWHGVFACSSGPARGSGVYRLPVVARRSRPSFDRRPGPRGRSGGL
ncbi:MAG: hypothetical protein AVDCRST_MAG71-603, partial [uncultured Lysobacter sp.]